MFSTNNQHEINALPNRNLLNLNGSSNPAFQASIEKESHHAREGSVSLMLFPELFQDGKQRAIASGALTILPADLEPLMEHAKAIARQARRDPFDPANGPADRLRLSEFEKIQADRLEMEMATHNLAASLQDAEERLANLFMESSLPPALRWYYLGGTTAIALTVAVALHDVVFIFADEITAWLCSFLLGIVCGGVITAFLLIKDSESQSGIKSSRTGIIAGILCGVALFALRIATPQTWGGMVFASGMTMLEIGIVIGLHHVAKQHWINVQKFREEEKAIKKAQSLCEVLKANLAEHQQQLLQIEAKINEHIRYVSDRQVRHQHADQLEELAVAAVRDGYAAGVSENVGRRRNVKTQKGGHQ